MDVEVARAADELHGHVDEPEAERAGPQRAGHISRPGSPRARPPGRRRARAPLGGELDLLARRLALDQLQHRVAVGVLVVARARTPRPAISRAGRPSRPRASPACGRRLGRSRSPARRPRRGSASCAARGRRRAGARRPAARGRGRPSGRCRRARSQRRVQQPVGVLAASRRRGNRSCRRRADRSRRRHEVLDVDRLGALAGGGLDLVRRRARRTCPRRPRSPSTISSLWTSRSCFGQIRRCSMRAPSERCTWWKCTLLDSVAE